MTLPEICEAVTRLARLYSLGTIGIAGVYAAGIQRAGDPLAVLLAVSLSGCEAFGIELSEALGCEVHLHDCRGLSWASPLHVCVRWLNVDVLPVIECPRGATMRVRIPRPGKVVEMTVRLESLPHFRGVDCPRHISPSGTFRMFSAPLGGFLL